MTVNFNKQRQRWTFDFWKSGKRYRGYCVDAHGQPVSSKSAAKQAEGVARRSAELEPKTAKPGELTFAMAIAALTPVWSAQDSWFARKIWLRELIAYFGLDASIATIDQATVDDYVSRCRTAKIMAWTGGPNRNPSNPDHVRYWKSTDRTRSPATVNLYLGTLRQILNRAASLRDGRTGLPAFGWLPKVPELRKDKRKARPMPDQVASEIMSIMPGHVVDAMVLTALFGFRRGEAFGLKRTDVDWDHNGVRLMAEGVKDAEDVFLPGDDFAMGYLRCLDMEAETRGLRELISWRPSRDGEYVAISHPRSAWRRARAFMEAKYGRTWRWHDLRAAFITHVAMTSGGMVAKQLARHSSFETTQGYIEVADEAQRLAAQRISGRAQQFESHQRNSPTAAFQPTPGKRKVLK